MADEKVSQQQAAGSVWGAAKQIFGKFSGAAEWVWNLPQRNSETKVSFSGQASALTRDFANDVRDSVNTVFFGQPGNPPGMGTPMGPTPGMVDQGLEAMYGPAADPTQAASTQAPAAQAPATPAPAEQAKAAEPSDKGWDAMVKAAASRPAPDTSRGMER